MLNLIGAANADLHALFLQQYMSVNKGSLVIYGETNHVLALRLVPVHPVQRGESR